MRKVEAGPNAQEPRARQFYEMFLPALGFMRDAQIEPGQYDAEKLSGTFFASPVRGGASAPAVSPLVKN